MNEGLLKYLKYYLQIEDPRFAILINGKWGSGKTFFIKQQIKNWKPITLSYDNKGWNSIKLKPLYVSLFGISTTHGITNKINEQMFPILHSKGVKFVKKLVSTGLKISTSLSYDLNNDGNDDGKMSLSIDPFTLFKNSTGKKSDRIIVLDDLERCKVPLETLFGYINDLLEHHSCKVILLADEEKILGVIKEKGDSKKAESAKTDKAGNSDYLKFKEKIVGQTFLLESDFKSAINEFLKLLKNSNLKDNYVKSADLLQAIFDQSDIKNLRSLRQSILDLQRFIDDIDDEIKKESSYNQFIMQLIPHFTIAYLEFKNGNETFTEIKYDYFTQYNQVKPYDYVNEKYGWILRENSILENQFVIGYKYITRFIKDGFSNKLDLNEAINRSYVFRDRHTEAWEKLWYWHRLENDDFKILLQEVVTKLENKEFYDYQRLLHCIMILADIDRRGLMDFDQKYLVKLYKSNLLAVLSRNKEGIVENFDAESLGRAYIGYDTDFFRKLLEYTKDEVKKNNQRLAYDVLREVMENMTDENVKNLGKIMRDRNPSGIGTYSMCNIFENVNGKKKGESFLRLNNDSKAYFRSFVFDRYKSEGKLVLEKISEKEKVILGDFCQFLNKNLKNFELNDEFQVEMTINGVTEIISNNVN